MTIKTEEALKKELKLAEPKRVYLLYGEENLLKGAYLKKLEKRLGGEADRVDGKKLPVDGLCDSALLVPMMGGRRSIVVEDFDLDALGERDFRSLLELLENLPDSTSLIFVVREAAFDLKKSARAKKFLAAVDQNGLAACLDRRRGAELKSFVRARCQKGNCNISNENAALLIERCSDDMGLLAGEADKLCAYLGEGEITKELIERVASATIEGDVYALAKLILSQKAASVLKEVNALLFLKQPASAILASLGFAFTDLYRAKAAKSTGRTVSNVVADFSYRYEFRVTNAFRDCALVDQKNLFEACRILEEAELALKTSQPDERVLLESTIIRMMAALRGERLSC